MSYFERYARTFDLPIRQHTPVTGLTRLPMGPYEVRTEHGSIRAQAVVLATGSMSRPRIPEIARDLPAEVLSISAGEAIGFYTKTNALFLDVISEIAKETGLPSSAIKESIDLMRRSEAVLFTITTADDPNARKIEVLAKVQWNVGKTSKEQVLDWLLDKFALSHLTDFVSATEPTLFFKFYVKHVHDVEAVVQKAMESGLFTSMEPLFLLNGTTFPDPRVRKAHQLLEETGFSSHKFRHYEGE